MAPARWCSYLSKCSARRGTVSAGFGLNFFNCHTHLLLIQQRHHSALPSELPLATGNHFFTLSSGPSVPALTIHTPLSHYFISESTSSLPTTQPPVNDSPFDLPISSCLLSNHASLSGHPTASSHLATSPTTSSPTWIARAIPDGYSLSSFSCPLPRHSAPFPSKCCVCYIILQHPFLFLGEFNSVNPLHETTSSFPPDTES